MATLSAPLLISFIRQPLRNRLVALLFGVGVALIAIDFLYPLPYGQITGVESEYQHKWGLNAILEIIIPLMVIGACMLLPEKALRVGGTVFVLALLAGDVFALYQNMTGKEPSKVRVIDASSQWEKWHGKTILTDQEFVEPHFGGWSVFLGSEGGATVEKAQFQSGPRTTSTLRFHVERPTKNQPTVRFHINRIGHTFQKTAYLQFLSRSGSLSQVQVGFMQTKRSGKTSGEAAYLPPAVEKVSPRWKRARIKIDLQFQENLSDIYDDALTVSWYLPENQTADLELADVRLLLGDWRDAPKPFSLPVAESPRPPIRHIVFDGFYGPLFPKVVEQAGLTADDFKGFTYFPNAYSNHHGTRGSTTSFFSGTMFSDGELSRWLTTHEREGLLPALEEAGYNLESYVVGEGQGFIYSKRFKDINVLEKVKAQEQNVRKKLLLLDISLIRSFPPFLRPAKFSHSGWIASETLGRWLSLGSRVDANTLAPDMVRKLVADMKEVSEADYAYLHVLLPHAPFNLDENCNVMSQSYYDQRMRCDENCMSSSLHDYDQKIQCYEKCKLLGSSGYDRQMECSVRLMGEIVKGLEEIGKYDETMLIIQSDHGSAANSQFCANEPGEDLLEKIFPKKARFCQFKAETRPLLMVKPPYAEGSMQVSDRMGQLLDIPATILSTLEIPGKIEGGVSLFSKDFPSTRNVFVDTGLYFNDGEKVVWYGDYPGRMEPLKRFVVDEKGKWRFAGDVPCKW